MPNPSLLLHGDFETSSAADLAGVGVHRYAEHWTTRVLCLAYRFGLTGPVSCWYYWQPFPQVIIDHIAAGGLFGAHNASFERTMWNMVLRRANVVNNVPAIALPEMLIGQMVCTMARAATLNLPGGLDYVAQVMDIGQQKDAEGKKLMLKYCQPRSRTTDPLTGEETYTWWDDHADIERIGEYCKQDVIVESTADEVLMQHTARERRVWELDQTINERGVKLDVTLARAAVETVELAKEMLHERMNEVTDGAVPKCTQVAKLVAWINARGVPCTSAAGPLQEELILQAERLEDAAIVEAIELRQQSGKGTPTSKFQTMVDCANYDSRARGQLNYSGATTTGRWAGRLIQFQNMPGVDPDVDGGNVRAAIAILSAVHMTALDRVLAIRMICGTVLPVLAKCARYMLMAATGFRFIGGDLSNIEGCVAAWITDEAWKVQAYTDFQAGRGADLYKVAYSRAFGVPIEQIVQAQRQVGKVQELALGFQGGIAAFLKGLLKGKKKPGSIVKAVRDATPFDDWNKVLDSMKRPGTKTLGLTPDEWTALKVAVNGWRASNPQICAAWYELQDAAIDAVANQAEYSEKGEMTRPAKVVWALNGRVAYTVSRRILWCRLPSGRTLAYHAPRLQSVVEIQMSDAEGRTSFVAEAEVPKLLRAGFVETGREPRYKRKVSYQAYDGVTKRFVWFDMYGGLQFENIVQAVARDVMVEGMFAAEANGYPIVLTVHDELLCEVPIGHGSADELRQLMSIVPEWCAGLPLAAKCWEDPRYAK